MFDHLERAVKSIVGNIDRLYTTIKGISSEIEFIKATGHSIHCLVHNLDKINVELRVVIDDIKRKISFIEYCCMVVIMLLTIITFIVVLK